MRRFLPLILIFFPYFCLGGYTEEPCNRLPGKDLGRYAQAKNHIFRTDLLEGRLKERLDPLLRGEGGYVSGVSVGQLEETNFLYYMFTGRDFWLYFNAIVHFGNGGQFSPSSMCWGTIGDGGVVFENCYVPPLDVADFSIDGESIGLRECTARSFGDPDLGIHGH